MRPTLLLLFCLTACGGGPALIGTWQFDVNVRVVTPSGTEEKTLAVPIKLVAGAKTAVAWQVGGCTMDLQLVGEVGTLPLPSSPCTLTVTDDVPGLSQTRPPTSATAFPDQAALTEAREGPGPGRAGPVRTPVHGLSGRCAGRCAAAETAGKQVTLSRSRSA